MIDSRIAKRTAAQTFSREVSWLMAWAKGTHVAILHPNGSAFANAALAINRIGAVALPLSTMSTPFELQQILHDADVNLLLSAVSYRNRNFVEILQDAIPDVDLASSSDIRSFVMPSLRAVFFTDVPQVVESRRTSALEAAADEISLEVLTAVENSVRPSDPLVIVHTSGSTAKPKGVVHTHGAIVRHMISFNELRSFHHDDVLFSNSPFFWIGGYVTNIMAVLVEGATLVCSNALEPGTVLDLLEAERPSLLNGFAASVNNLAQDPSFADRDLSFLRRGNLYPIMPADVQPKDPELRHNMLGMTEAGSVFLFDPDETDQPERRRNSYGRICPGFEVRLVNAETGHDVPAGRVGEIWIRGRYMMEGYYGLERHEVFDASGWYHTGDLGIVDEEGFYYFRGRLSQMIKTAGANVSPLEVEAAIRDAAHLDAHCIGIDDPERGQIVAAVVLSSDPGGFDSDELRTLLTERLSAYKIPRRLRAIRPDQLPLMSSGKVDLRALRDLLR